MKKNTLFLVFMIFANVVFTANAGVLPELIKPDSLHIDDDRMFITEGIHIYIYSLKELKLLKKFGKEGEGPREFKKMPLPYLPSLFIHLKPDQIFVNSMGKVSFFTREGTYIKEMRNPGLFRMMIPFGEKYIGFGIIQEDKIQYFTYNLHDSDFNKEKEVYRVKSPIQEGRKIDPLIITRIKDIFFRYVHKRRFFLPTVDGIIHVFDENGKEVTVIKPDYRRQEITPDLERRFDTFFSTDVRFKVNYNNDKSANRIEFPDYLPLLRDYRVADGKVYVISNKWKDGKFESFIFDMMGNLLKKLWLPLVEKDMIEFFPFTITEGKIHQLVENENEEQWELHVTEIK
jgi:hypothetical protein